MNISISFSEDFISILLKILGFVVSVIITYYLGRYYIQRQKREVEDAERMMQESQHSVSLDSESTPSDNNFSE